MKIYEVTLPIAGYASVEVEANSEEEAVQKALSESDIRYDDIIEWQPYEHITQGNILYAPRNDATAEEVGEVE